MIEITKNKSHGICGSCTSVEDICFIQVSLPGSTGRTTIMLCKDCRHTLACKLLTIVLKDKEDE